MNRFHPESAGVYRGVHVDPDIIQASGWQSPSQRMNVIPASSVTRIIAECPFGKKKCSYTIDKSQPGRLVVIAQRRRSSGKSKGAPLDSKADTAIQTFLIPHDSDMAHLNSFTEKSTNRLIIEIPRLLPSYVNTDLNPSSPMGHSSNRMPWPTNNMPHVNYDNSPANRQYLNSDRNFQCHVDCHGYSADDLDIVVNGQNLIVQGKAHNASTTEPLHESISKAFSRRIVLPSTVDPSRVVYYLDRGQLIIEAPFKHEAHSYHNEQPVSSRPWTFVQPGHSSMNFDEHQTLAAPKSFQQNERLRRYREFDPDDFHRLLNPTRRAYSIDSLQYLHHPKTFRDYANDDTTKDIHRRRIVDYEQYITNRNDSRNLSVPKSFLPPREHFIRTGTPYRSYPTYDDVYSRN